MEAENKKTSNPTIQQGWNLRDEFASSAMQGILTTYNDQTSFDTFKHCANDLAITSYQIADAMLKQREL